MYHYEQATYLGIIVDKYTVQVNAQNSMRGQQHFFSSFGLDISRCHVYLNKVGACIVGKGTDMSSNSLCR